MMKIRKARVSYMLKLEDSETAMPTTSYSTCK
jgi:hypothetical protein